MTQSSFTLIQKSSILISGSNIHYFYVYVYNQTIGLKLLYKIVKTILSKDSMTLYLAQMEVIQYSNNHI